MLGLFWGNMGDLLRDGGSNLGPSNQKGVRLDLPKREGQGTYTTEMSPAIPLASISALAIIRSPQGIDSLPTVLERRSSETYSTVPRSMPVPYRRKASTCK